MAIGVGQAAANAANFALNNATGDIPIDTSSVVDSFVERHKADNAEPAVQDDLAAQPYHEPAQQESQPSPAKRQITGRASFGDRNLGQVAQDLIAKRAASTMSPVSPSFTSDNKAVQERPALREYENMIVGPSLTDAFRLQAAQIAAEEEAKDLGLPVYWQPTGYVDGVQTTWKPQSDNQVDQDSKTNPANPGNPGGPANPGGPGGPANPGNPGGPGNPNNQGSKKQGKNWKQKSVGSNVHPRTAGLSEREEVDQFIEQSYLDRLLSGMQQRESDYNLWLQDNPGKTMGEYVTSPDYTEDLEMFGELLPNLMGKYEAMLGANSSIPGRDFKDNRRQDLLVDRVVSAFRLGFFHVYSEKLETDQATGEKYLRWGNDVTRSINRVCDYFGMDPLNIDDQRMVFRLVILYASMGIDRNGKMFNEESNEWYLTQDEFSLVCNLIIDSCETTGIPMAMPYRSKAGYHPELRRTEIIPSGVMPRVVAEAITGPNSKLRYRGAKPTADELVEMCRVEWLTKTNPWMKSNLVNERGDEKNRVSQRVAIYDMQQGFARIDGTGPEDFSERYNVETSLHNRLEEYVDTNVLYVTAMNGDYDAQKVGEYQRELFEEVRDKLKERRGRKEYTAVDAACNIVTSGIRANALLANVPIALSSIAEKGVGCLQTSFAIKSISKISDAPGSEPMQVSQKMIDAFMSKEGHEAIDSALMLLELGGPEALLTFSKPEGNKKSRPLTKDEVVAFANDVLLPQVKNEGTEKIVQFERKLKKIQRMVLAGDFAFKNFDATNYLNALLTGNQVLIGVQNKLVEMGQIDEHAGIALTGAELDDIFLAHNGDVASFLSEIMGTAAGRDALMMMRANNIANFNPVGHSINLYMREHGVTNALVTTFIDSFVSYGVNFLYAITPFSRTLTYLTMKHRESTGDKTAGLFTIGGGLADVSGKSFAEYRNDPAFIAGLRMNAIYDAMTVGRWSITGLIVGAMFAALGFEPPDDPEDLFNVSKWKIHGEEIQLAYWLNDLTQLGLPLAYGTAAMLSGQSPYVAGALMLDSLYDQVDGNVVVDMLKYIKKWPGEFAELEKMANDPTYDGRIDWGYAPLELFLSALDKMVPGAPIYRTAGKTSILEGPNATQVDPNKEYDLSSDWAKSVNKTNYISDQTDRIFRKHSTANWLLAGWLDFYNGVLLNKEHTGYFWWQMPAKTRSEPIGMTWAATQEMDYANREGLSTDKAYEEAKTWYLLDQIDWVTEEYGGLEQAAMNGYFISHDIRVAALNVLSDELIELQDEFDANSDAGRYTSNDAWWDAYNDLKQQKDKIWDYINILRDTDKIPEWYENLEVLRSDWEVTFTHPDGTPATGIEYLLPWSDVQAKWNYKGNHPFILAPLTFVDKTSNDLVTRAPNGETVQPFARYGEDGGVNVEAIRNGIGTHEIPYGINAGKTLNDVIFGVDENGEPLHPEYITTGQRALKPMEK